MPMRSMVAVEGAPQHPPPLDSSSSSRGPSRRTPAPVRRAGRPSHRSGRRGRSGERVARSSGHRVKVKADLGQDRQVRPEARKDDDLVDIRDGLSVERGQKHPALALTLHRRSAEARDGVHAARADGLFGVRASAPRSASSSFSPPPNALPVDRRRTSQLFFVPVCWSKSSLRLVKAVLAETPGQALAMCLPARRARTGASVMSGARSLMRSAAERSPTAGRPSAPRGFAPARVPDASMTARA